MTRWTCWAWRTIIWLEDTSDFEAILADPSPGLAGMEVDLPDLSIILTDLGAVFDGLPTDDEIFGDMSDLDKWLAGC